VRTDSSLLEDASRCRARREQLKREGNNLKGFNDGCLNKWLKSRSESGRDCLMCAEFSQQRHTREVSGAQFRVSILVLGLGFGSRGDILQWLRV